MSGPLRFSEDGIEVRYTGRWRSSKFGTIVAIGFVVSGLAWAAFQGPAWIAMPAMLIIAAPAVAIFIALIWTGAEVSAKWMTERWFPIPTALLVITALFTLAANEINFPGPEPSSGYAWGAVGLAYLASVVFWRWRQNGWPLL